MQEMEKDAPWKVPLKTSIQSNWHSNLQLIFDHLQKEIASPNALQCTPHPHLSSEQCLYYTEHRSAWLQNNSPSDLVTIHENSSGVKVVARIISTYSETKAQFCAMVEENKRVRIVRMNFIQVEVYLFLWDKCLFRYHVFSNFAEWLGT